MSVQLIHLWEKPFSKQVNSLKNSDSKEESIELKLHDDDHTVSERSIIYHAIYISKNCIALTEKLGEYYSAAEKGLKAQRKFIDPLLYKAICWLMDDKLFKDTDDIPIDGHCLSIACDHTTLSICIMSPKHLGFAVDFHHTFRSRKLIDLIITLDYCVSYTIQNILNLSCPKGRIIQR